MNKFKVGDRVKVYSNNIWNEKSGKITKIQNDNVRLEFCKKDGYKDWEWFHYKQCRKLVKKCKPKFKIGDRVSAYSQKNELVCKGIITIINTKEVWIDTDDNKTLISPLSQLKKLVKKKSELKISDRVMARFISGYKTKATITKTDKQNDLYSIICDKHKGGDNYVRDRWHSCELTKLRKMNSLVKSQPSTTTLFILNQLN